MSEQQYILGQWINVPVLMCSTTGERVIARGISNDGTVSTESVCSRVWLPGIWLDPTFSRHALQPGVWL